MEITRIPFVTTDWSQIERTEHPGETGVAYWRTHLYNNIRVRMIEYSPGYSADHWCSKGHVVLCLEGEFTTRIEDGRQFVLKAGMSFQVADGVDRHRSSSATGAKLFVVD